MNRDMDYRIRIYNPSAIKMNLKTIILEPNCIDT